MRAAVASAAAAALAALLAGCGASSGSASGGSGTPSGGSAATPSAPATTQAAGGSMGCLAGTWRSNGITDAHLSLQGGVGAVLTISSNGDFVMNAEPMHGMTFSTNGVTGTVRITGQETGTFRVSGSKLGGVYHAGTFTVSAEVAGIKFKLPLSRFGTGGKSLHWESFSCSGKTLSLINPPPGSTWTFTRTG